MEKNRIQFELCARLVDPFSLAYLHPKKDGDVQRSKHQAHTMDGVVISCFPTLNALLVYNPRNKQYYEPDSYALTPIVFLAWPIHP